MISAILIITCNGEVLVSHDYRNEVDTETATTAFSSSLKKLKDGFLKELVPEMELPDRWIYHILRNSLYFVALSRVKQPSLMVIEILSKLFTILHHFCGAVSEDSIKANFTLIQEILLEFMDSGYVQLGTSEKLRPVVYSEPVVPRCRPPISDGVQWGLFGLEKPAVPGEASNKPYFTSRSTSEMAKEEIFVDVVENLFVFIDKEGTVKRSEINGKIVMKNFVSGSIDVKLGLNKDLTIRSSQSDSGLGSSACLDYCRFHEMVGLESFESNRVLYLLCVEV
ncbi:AP-4 complex subunit mu-1 [Chamberlinius hualienensis]